MKPLMIFVVAISMISMLHCSSDDPKTDAAVDGGVSDVMVVDALVDVSGDAVDAGVTDLEIVDSSDGEVADAITDATPSE